jgi:putative ATPase
MLTAGEEPLFLLRRLTCAAVEDIGLADPQRWSVAAKDTYDSRQPGGRARRAGLLRRVSGDRAKSNAVYKARKAAWNGARD